MSCLVFGVVTAVIEMSTYLPVSGASMAYYATRFVSPSLGFALGWLYFYSFGIIVAYELTAASIVIGYWPNSVPIAVWITVMMICIVGMNLCPVAYYAEAEFWFASIKVVMILGMLLLSLILMCGGGPDNEVLGFKYWSSPGAVKAFVVDGAGGRFTAFLYVWVFSGFSFYFGAELMVFTSGEMRNPRKNLPTASRRYFIRLAVFYMLGTLAIGVICPSNAKGLTSSAGNANASPWVIAIQNAAIPILPSIINAGILTSAWSAGNSYLYMSSRALYSLAVAGNAPKVFARCNRWGLPIYAVVASSLFTPFAYLNCGDDAGVVFNWFISLTNTAGYTSWIVCCLIFLRFRKACHLQNIVVPFKSRTQPWAAWICLVTFSVLLLCNGFTLFFPGNFTTDGFLTTYLGIPIFLVLYLGHKFTLGRKEPWAKKAQDVYLISDLADIEADAIMWTEMESLERVRSQDRSLLWRIVSRLWE